MKKERRFMVIDLVLIVFCVITASVSFEFETYARIFTMSTIAMICFVAFMLLNIGITINKPQKELRTGLLFLKTGIKVLLILLVGLFIYIKYTYLYDAKTVQFQEVTVNETTIVLKEYKRIGGTITKVYIKLNKGILVRTDCINTVSIENSTINDGNYKVVEGNDKILIYFKQPNESDFSDFFEIPLN